MARIPDNKQYFRIGEASRIIGVKPYILRYWEKEFSQITPIRADSGQRIYKRKDLEIILEIKKLLYDEKMTIEGVKRRLKQRKIEKRTGNDLSLKDLNAELNEILKILS